LAKKILIIDDEADLVALIKEELTERGYDTLSAENGKEALELITKEGLPDLILLDMKMPVMNGWEFSQSFIDLYGRSCPLVIMTAADDSRTRAMEIGADSYLGKPFEFGELVRLIESLLVE
jgi:DNA-binding response OmpR family regulator